MLSEKEYDEIYQKGYEDGKNDNKVVVEYAIKPSFTTRKLKEQQEELKLKTDFIEELLTIISVARDYELQDKCYTRSKIYQDKLKELKEGK